MIGTLAILFLFIGIHLFAGKVSGRIWQGKFLSFAGGISIAYVFIDLLPALASGQPILRDAFQSFGTYLDRHAYLFALLGLLFFYCLGGKGSGGRAFMASMGGYAVFNLFVGASLADENNPDIQPLFLFAVAIGLHYFVTDQNLRIDHPVMYDKYGRWILVAALIVGWLIGFYIDISDYLIALVVAFVAGGVMLNVMRSELPKQQSGTNLYFVLGALLYTLILLQVGVH